MVFGAPRQHARPAFDAQVGATTFPPVEHFDRGLSSSGGPPASRNTFSVSTITGGNARQGSAKTDTPCPYIVH